MYVDCRKELEKAIKDEYKIRMQVQKYTPYKLPTCYKYYRKNKDLYLTIEKVNANMQDNCGAFDSWSLVIKNWLTDIDRIILKWEKPEDTHNPNYQRFLYRVQKATQVYSWLVVEESCIPLLEELMIKLQNQYVVNVPNKEAQENAANPEAKIERTFVNYYNVTLTNAVNIDNTILHNQLPVGLFKDRVAEENEIFPSKNAMVDIWGINQRDHELHLFELKKPDADPMGIYSELFFYTMFENDVIQGRFIYKDVNPTIKYRGINYLINSQRKSIKAHFLVAKLHPLMDKAMIDLINASLKAYDIEFDYIKYVIDSNNIVTNCKKIF